ncbi:MAG: exodeoxyribonuclease VII large subunit [Candidatus Dormibacteraeota bacterium]|nr:exodeoxyribonuclease VII large subunit [Candidatus Dormibacteraeota bacterium]
MIRPEQAARPFTVTELALEVRRTLRPLSSVLVKGEVTGMKLSAKGHYSFAIRDRGAVVQAFLFAADARRLGLVPEDGQEFIFRGRVDFWQQAGQLRLVVDFIQFDDFGRLRAQLEGLKHRLEGEGAFSPERKRPLPFLPRVVALLTSPTGAVIHDLQETILDRFPNMEILVYPAQVQGTASPASVVSALRRCNREGRAEVAVIARGGGSFEELYAFNTEPVARAILNSRIPVVTALGHTSDRTVADMVADAECRTPTEAAARVVPSKSELAAQLAERHRTLAREAGRRVAREEERLQQRRLRLGQSLPSLLRLRSERLERCRTELTRLNPGRQVLLRREHLAQLGERLEAAAQRLVRTRSGQLESRRTATRLRRAVGERLKAAESGLAYRSDRLEALSPQRVLARGYSITTDEGGRVVRSPVDTGVGRGVQVRLARGRLRARVEEVEP